MTCVQPKIYKRNQTSNTSSYTMQESLLSILTSEPWTYDLAYTVILDFEPDGTGRIPPLPSYLFISVYKQLNKTDVLLQRSPPMDSLWNHLETHHHRHGHSQQDNNQHNTIPQPILQPYNQHPKIHPQHNPPTPPNHPLHLPPTNNPQRPRPLGPQRWMTPQRALSHPIRLPTQDFHSPLRKRVIRDSRNRGWSGEISDCAVVHATVGFYGTVVPGRGKWRDPDEFAAGCRADGGFGAFVARRVGGYWGTWGRCGVM